MLKMQGQLSDYFPFPGFFNLNKKPLSSIRILGIKKSTDKCQSIDLGDENPSV